MNGVIEFFYHSQGRDSLNNTQHTHQNCYEIIQTLTDGGSILIKNKIYPMTNGGLYYIDGGETHCTVPSNPEKYVRNKLLLSKSFVDGLAELGEFSDNIKYVFTERGGGYYPLSTDNAKSVDGAFANIGRCLNDPNMRPRVLMEILKLLYFYYTTEETSLKELYPKVSLILDYIDAHITESISTDQISAAVHLNKYYLCHFFKKTTNMTIFEYIQSRRISIAKRKLIYTEETISDIAMSLGFGSFSYFSSRFRSVVGITPQMFRKQYSDIYKQ